MDRSLIEAAQNGDVNRLRNLIGNDPFLFKPSEWIGRENPLHIASKAIHADFVNEVMYHRPEFAKELNQDGFSPLHIASAKGDLDTVKALLKAGPHLCLLRGKDHRIALHYAVVGGKVHVIHELLSACLDSIKRVTADGETCFHLAVKYDQFGAIETLSSQVKLLCRKDTVYVLNRKDKQGNSILHLAASRKQYQVRHHQVLEYLLLNLKPYLELNSLNKRDLTPLDVLVPEEYNIEIRKKLEQAGAKHAANLWIFTRKVADRFKNDMIIALYLPNQYRNTMLVVAVLIAAATYQAILSPPGGLWQDTVMNDPSTKPHVAGKSVMGTLEPVSFAMFLIFNSIGFMGSMAMLIVLIHGLPLINEFIVALASVLGTYLICTVTVTPNHSWLIGVVLLILLALVVLFCNLIRNMLLLEVPGTGKGPNT